ncbi:hypothetical protein DIPPA_16412 [Diplonema papillatum]|nr:hypothetical protein DIPPA_16412 [Diplonema papillatum]
MRTSLAAVCCVASLASASDEWTQYYFPAASAGPNASAELLLVNTTGMSPGEVLAVHSLQGVAAQTKPWLFTANTPDGQAGWSLWARELELYWNVTFRTESSFANVMKEAMAANLANSFVEVTMGTDSVGVGLMQCALRAQTSSPCVVCADTACDTLTQLQYKPAGDSRNATYEAFYAATPLTSFRQRVSILQKPATWPSLADYAAFCRCPVYFVPSFSPVPSMVAEILKYTSAEGKGAVTLGYGPDEFDTVSALSESGNGLLASDWALNVATMTNYGMGAVPQFSRRHVQPKPSAQQHAQQQADDDNRHVIAFVMTDGDNLQWLDNTFATSAQWYGCPRRGAVPVGWTLSVSSRDVAAPIYHYLQRVKTQNDTFVGSVSGDTYTYIDEMPDKWATIFTNESASNLKADGIAVVNVMGSTTDLATAAAAAVPYFRAGMQHVLYYPYSGYSNLNGNNTYVSTPEYQGWLLGARYCLWQGQHNVSELIGLLNSQAMDPTSSAGYSVIPVHVWSHTYDDIVSVVNGLNTTRTRVVSLDEYAQLINRAQ